MKNTPSHFFSRRLSAWFLMIALLLSGCTGSTDSTSEKGTDESDISAASDASDTNESVSEASEESDEPLDYSKYNAYLEVLNNVYEMDGLLTAYFTVVQNEPEFALVEGMDYSMLDDAFSFYTFNSSAMDYAMDYCEKDPAYPEQDALLAALNEPFLAMGEILGDLGWYISYKDYEDDNMAEAAQLHAKLYEAVTAFDEAAWPFAEAMDALDEATEQDELDRLKEEGLDIAYYSRIMINLADELDAEIWAQLAQSETAELPPLDMTNLETLYTQHQDAYASLTEALADPERVKAIWPDESTSESQAEVYGSAAEKVSVALDSFMTAARNQEDYSQAYDTYYSAVSYLIDLYNSMLS